MQCTFAISSSLFICLYSTTYHFVHLYNQDIIYGMRDLIGQCAIDNYKATSVEVVVPQYLIARSEKKSKRQSLLMLEAQ